jgi:cytochrome b
MSRTLIWTLPARVFHWWLALSFLAAFLTGGEEEVLNIHAACGVAIFSLLIFRVSLGIAGPRYTRFSDFPATPSKVITFLTSLKNKGSEYPGHNPAASLIMIGIMLSGLLSACSGMLLLGEEGIFPFRVTTGINEDSIKEFHEVIVHVMLVFVGVHLAGLILDTIIHPRNGTVFSMVTGYKNLVAEPAKTGLFWTIVAPLWFLMTLMLMIYTWRNQPVSTDGNKEQNEQTETEEDD